MKKLSGIIKKIDGFIVGILAAIFLAWLFPGVGERDSWLSLKTLADIGVSLIFFFYGLKLSPKEIREGVSNYKLHFAVQASTFIIFPLCVILFQPLIQTSQQYELWLGLMFLASLPSTVSSSVVMVSIAKGNIPGAIFNASLSGLLGIIFTPVWMGLFINVEAESYNYITIVLKLFLYILLPVFAGAFLQRYWGDWARAHKKKLALFDKLIILIIVFRSFGNSFENKIFAAIPVFELLLLFFLVILLFWIIYGGMHILARIFHFNRQDSITLYFCGSKKSLMHGTVFLKVLFTNSANLGIYLLPVMVYHAMQLLIIGYIAHRKGREQ